MKFWLMLEVLGAGAALAVLAIALWLEPDPSGHGTLPSLFPPCGYKLETGHPCLSCGMTTAFVNMMHARPLTAWHANPAGVALFIITLITPFWLIHAAFSRRDPLRFSRHPWARWIFPATALFVLAVWLARSGL